MPLDAVDHMLLLVLLVLGASALCVAGAAFEHLVNVCTRRRRRDLIVMHAPDRACRRGATEARGKIR